MSKEFVQYHNEPELHDPIVVAAFAGWNDAADSATTAIKILIERWKPEKIAEIDSEDFFVFTETRPTMKMTGGVYRSITWPTNQFFAYQAPHLSHDIILCLGVEPQLKWKTFSKSFLGICRHFKVSEAVLLGALLADVPHSIAVPITGIGSDIDVQERLHEMDVHGSRYEGPTGMIGVLQDVCRSANIPAASLWAAAPHYLAATPNIKVTSALLTYLNTFLSLGLDLGELQSDALRFDEQISVLVARDPEASAYVRKLEEQVNESLDEEEEDEENAIDLDKPPSTGPLPSAETLIRGVEDLLRQQRENGQSTSLDDNNDGNENTEEESE